MTQHPDGPPDRGVPRHPGGGQPPQHPGGMLVPPRPPRSGGLRLLLRLTIASFAASVLNGVAEAFAGPTTFPGMEGVGTMPDLWMSELAVAVGLFGVVLTAGLYALVYFPLRDQRQWGWVLGLVFCSLAVLGDAFSLLLQLLGGHPLVGLTTLLLVAVNVVWLVVAGRPGVRAALR